MSSVVQTSSPRSASRKAHAPATADVAMVATLGVIAPSIDPLVRSFIDETQETLPFVVAHQVMNVQRAVADARVALERRFPELKTRTKHPQGHHRASSPMKAQEMIRLIHHNLWGLEERIRAGYRCQESAVAIRDAVVGAAKTKSPSALTVLDIVVASSQDANFDLSDPSNARALGILSNLAEVTSRVKSS